MNKDLAESYMPVFLSKHWYCKSSLWCIMQRYFSGDCDIWVYLYAVNLSTAVRTMSDLSIDIQISIIRNWNNVKLYWFFQPLRCNIHGTTTTSTTPTTTNHFRTSKNISYACAVTVLHIKCSKTVTGRAHNLLIYK